MHKEKTNKKDHNDRDNANPLIFAGQHSVPLHYKREDHCQYYCVSAALVSPLICFISFIPGISYLGWL